MQSSKSTKKSPKTTEQNKVVPEATVSVETPQPRKRSVAAASPSESKLKAKAAPQSGVQTSATADKAAPKTTLHRSSKRTAEKPAATVKQAETPVTVVSVAAAEASAPIEEPTELLAMAAAVGASGTKVEVVAPDEITQTAIAELAYSYYVARGYQPGNQHDDWFRAEIELYSRR